MPRTPTDPRRLALELVLPTWTTADLHWEGIVAIAEAAAEAGFEQEGDLAPATPQS